MQQPQDNGALTPKLSEDNLNLRWSCSTVGFATPWKDIMWFRKRFSASSRCVTACVRYAIKHRFQNSTAVIEMPMLCPCLESYIYLGSVA